MEQKKMSAKTLVLVTRPLGENPGEWARLALKAADRVILMQDGVFNGSSLFGHMSPYGIPGGHRAAHDPDAETGDWPGNCFAMEEDAAIRGGKAGIKLIGYAELVEAVAAHQ
ncbi:MAG: DsrH/TusB family sulfur relay protein, partial [Nitrospinota bacterium]|nr:DsrH/TusB family sulfur relay protein [Nitrospinota bacterium]